MTALNLLISKKTGVAIIGLMLLLALRWEPLLASAWKNSGLTAFLQIPAWRLVAVEDLPKDIEPVTVFVQRAFSAANDSVTLAKAYGLLLFVQGREDEAAAVWQAAGLSAAEVTAVQGRYAESVNRSDAAVIWFEQAVAFDENLASAWHALGWHRQQVGDSAMARTAYEQALALGFASSVDPLARLWRDDGDHETAAAIWQSALQHYPIHADRLRWWQGLTNSLRAAARWDEGWEAVTAALQEFPEDAWLYVEKAAIVYGRSADADAAMEAVHTAVSLDDTVVGAYSTAAGILAAERRYEAAYDWYTEAIRRSPNNSSWYVARGHMARAAGDLSLALESFQIAIERFPSFPAAYFGIAVVYQKLDESGKAVEAVQQAVQLNRNMQVSDYLLAAEIYEWSGELEQAVNAYQQILLLNPDNPVASQALQRLQNE